TVREQESHPVFRWIERPASAWVAFALALLLVQCWSYLELWTDERGLAAAATAAGTVGIVAVWSLVWAAASRLILHKSNFRRHVTIISLYLTGSVGVWYVQSYVNFLTNENWVSAAVQYAVNFGVLFVLLYATLRFTTRME